MPVDLDDKDRAVAWGEKIEGEEIPYPPDTLVQQEDAWPKWDRTNQEWVADTSLPRGPEGMQVRRNKKSSGTTTHLKDLRDTGDIQGQLDEIYRILDIETEVIQ